MDHNRFDRYSRFLALRSNRRNAAKQAGIGLAATTLGMVGIELATAQDTATHVCEFDFVAMIRVDPDMGFTPDPGTLSGVLAFTVGEDGQLENGTLTFTGGDSWELTGFASGPFFSARVQFLPGRALVFVGVGERSIDECAGTMDGMLTGSDPGALGDWHASASGESPGTSSGVQQGSGGEAPASLTQTPTSESEVPPQGEPPQAPTRTPTPTLASVEPADECASGLTECDDRCVDLSSDPEHCGACSAPCQDPQACSAGECVCPDGACNPGAALDPVTCECICPASWIDCGDACCEPGSQCRDTVCCDPEGTVCAGPELCCSGTCDFLVGGGTCAPCLGRPCSDAQACCGGLSCSGGYCGGCRDRATSCTSNDQCCYSDCFNGACLSDQGGRCSRNVDCRECYLNGNCAGACRLGVCGGQLLPETQITAVVLDPG